MRVLAARDRRHHLADVDAVLDHRVPRFVVFQCQFVADRDVAFGGDAYFLVVLHDPADQFLALLHALDDDHADAIAFFMHDEMDHSPLRSIFIRKGGILVASLQPRAVAWEQSSRRRGRKPGGANRSPARTTTRWISRSATEPRLSPYSARYAPAGGSHPPRRC